MNQILVTEKIYVTPELKRKKKLYKILFIISILLIISLFSFYAYSEYDKNRQEGISGDILSFLTKKDNTIISENDNALVVKITQEATEDIEEVDNTEEVNAANNSLQMEIGRASCRERV